MKYLNTTQRITIPDGVDVKIKSRKVVIKGPKGSITKDLSHLQLDLEIVDSKKHPGKKDVCISKWFAGYKQRTIVQTCNGIFRNLFNGVTKGFRYRMRIVYAHFPIKLFPANDKKSIEIKNFLGGTHTQLITMKPGCTVYLNPKQKEEIVIDGIDVEYVSQCAALINQCVKIGKKDVRKFMDGIYVSERTFQDVEDQ